MNARQKKFILKKLIPFILREQGRGFAMSVWDSRSDEVNSGDTINEDGLDRTVPGCGTVCCIGGSTIFLKKGNLLAGPFTARKILGLTHGQAVGLFFNWNCGPNEEGEGAWPRKFQKAFAACKTTLGKAKIAVALLKEVVRTNGKCLERD